MLNKLIENMPNEKITLIHILNLNEEHLLFTSEILASYFDVLEFIHYPDNTSLLISKNNPTIDDEFTDLLNTLRFDTGLNLRILFGNTHFINEELNKIVEYERDLIEYAKEEINFVNNLYLKKKLKEINISTFNPFVYNMINQDEELKDMIIKLWETYRNISKASTELYIHRNTLIYRINKFEDESGLNLDNPNDLLIAYLMTI